MKTPSHTEIGKCSSESLGCSWPSCAKPAARWGTSGLFALSQALIGAISASQSSEGESPSQSIPTTCPAFDNSTSFSSFHFMQMFGSAPWNTTGGKERGVWSRAVHKITQKQEEDQDCPEILLSSFIPSDAAPLGRHQDPSLHRGPCCPHLVTLQCCPQPMIHFEPAFELLFI